MTKYNIELDDGTKVISESKYEFECAQSGGSTDPSWEAHWVCTEEGRTWVVANGLRLLIDDKVWGTPDGKALGVIIAEKEMEILTA